jgi:hypothetical protein
VKLVGVGKESHMGSLGNWTNGNNSSVCADSSPFSVWSDWEASQRDLFVLDHHGNLVLHENISGGLPTNLESLVMGLVDQISDCDPDLMCGQALTCCDDLMYATTCCAENCDEPIGECGECIDGEVNDDNPCNPMECWEGEWVEIIIDCAEAMGVPCEGGVYFPPEGGECCSICVSTGDIGGDGVINVLDVVAMVSLVLNGQYEQVADMNADGVVNVLDVVQVVFIILNPEP